MGYNLLLLYLFQLILSAILFDHIVSRLKYIWIGVKHNIIENHTPVVAEEGWYQDSY